MKAEREARIVQEKGEGHGHAKGAGLRAWLKDAGIAIKQNWVLFIYMVFLMSFFNACSHGSQDFYPTFLKNREFDRCERGRADRLQKLKWVPRTSR
jgi:MFS transporter, SHS family, lactate transporter